MNGKIFSGFLALTSLAGADGQWVLASSTLTYHVSHPLHQSEGASHAARGKGVCQGGQCNFLIAAPVKSFESGDTNRDLHMVQVTHGAQFPLVSARVSLLEAALTSASIRCDVEIEFAGRTAKYKDVVFQVLTSGSETRITGSIPATLSDFKIEAPSLLSIPVKNDMPVRVDMTWRPM
ncbi:MAG: hypothetical protein ABSC05_16320 [Candidatus Solibacter sp.]|jgi:hypothetical protein